VRAVRPVPARTASGPADGRLWELPSCAATWSVPTLPIVPDGSTNGHRPRMAEWSSRLQPLSGRGSTGCPSSRPSSLTGSAAAVPPSAVPATRRLRSDPAIAAAIAAPGRRQRTRDGVPRKRSARRPQPVSRQPGCLGGYRKPTWFPGRPPARLPRQFLPGRLQLPASASQASSGDSGRLAQLRQARIPGAERAMVPVDA